MTNVINSLKDYTTWGKAYQLSLPFNYEVQFSANDPVRLVRSFIARMDLSSLYKNCRHINKNQATPAQMLAILVYAYCNKIFSTRGIEEACHSNIKFMYLLEGKTAPDHTTIHRFFTKHLRPCIREILAQMGMLLEKLGAVSLTDLFIDGTKLESRGNKYSFSWRKSVEKNQGKLFAKLPIFLEKTESDLGIHVRHKEANAMRRLKFLRIQLLKQIEEKGVVFVHGTGKRKTPLQRTFEEIEVYIARIKDYTLKLHGMKGRNSYSKTDKDATFMRMKEDAMKNGQLKPAYNVQYGSNSEFILWANIGHQPTDTNTLIPFLRKFKQYYGKFCQNVIADAGYESEENYSFLENNGITSYIKPVSYEMSKTRKWKHDIGRFENMTYIPDEDAYICANGRKLTVEKIYNLRTKTGYKIKKTNYACKDCSNCSVKENCIHGNHFKKPFEERTKRLSIAKKFIRQRQEDLKRITSDEGIELRLNRNIQAEGAFADIKADLNFRRFLCWGRKNALVAVVLLAMAHNIQKLHHKIQRGIVDRHRIPVKQAA